MKHEPDTRYFAVATAIVVVVNVVVAFVPWCGSQVELQQDDSSRTDAKQTTSSPPVSVDQRTKFFRRHCCASNPRMETMESRILYSGTGLDGVHMTAVGRTCLGFLSLCALRCPERREAVWELSLFLFLQDITGQHGFGTTVACVFVIIQANNHIVDNEQRTTNNTHTHARLWWGLRDESYQCHTRTQKSGLC